MGVSRWLGVVGVCVAIGCGRPAMPPASPISSVGELGSTSSGGPDGQYSQRYPFYRYGPVMLVSGMVAYPGKPEHPAFLLAIKLASGNDFGVHGGSSSDGGEMKWTHRIDGGLGENLIASYTMTRKPVAEALKLSGKAWDLGKGRVFLVDLTVSPPLIEQLADDVGELLPTTTPGTTEFGVALAKLKERHELARELFPLGK